jgi:hypothetical protein
MSVARLYTDSMLPDGSVDGIRFTTKILVLRDTCQLISSKMIHLFAVTSPASLELPSSTPVKSQGSLILRHLTLFHRRGTSHGIQSLKSSLFLSGMRTMSIKSENNPYLYQQQAMGDSWPSSRLR